MNDSAGCTRSGELTGMVEGWYEEWCKARTGETGHLTTETFLHAASAHGAHSAYVAAVAASMTTLESRMAAARLTPARRRFVCASPE